MNPRFLWVEDDPNDVLLLGREMQEAGLGQPILARDGEEAVRYLAGEGEFGDRVRHPLPSFILLDLRLPRFSGLEVLAWRKEQPVVRRIPAIVLTSSAEQVDIVRAYDLGANAYLVKPLDSRRTVEMLRAVHSFWVQHNRTAE
ncbi:MAG: response regulator [Planctomycetes bacterium]|nr:response regulator [Planctomycetota bacterium]